ncbi:MAG TPA: hypothetical protein VHT24_11485 [Pseudacidobacterium sp.]|nr:hypothetical protein [Pseudacidobacterium sp.]
MKKSRALRLWLSIVLFFGLLCTFSAPSLQAQRLSDKDVEALMRNLHEDAKSFRSSFDEELKKSTIRRTSQEKDARSLAGDFEKKTGEMLSEFKKSKKGDVAVETTMDSAQEIDRIINSMQVSGRLAAQWEKVRTELSQVSSAFGINAHYSRM